MDHPTSVSGLRGLAANLGGIHEDLWPTAIEEFRGTLEVQGVNCVVFLEGKRLTLIGPDAFESAEIPGPTRAA